MNAIGRKVRSCWGDEGIVSRWEPLSSGMCDTLVTLLDGREVWYAMSSLKPADGLGELPSRHDAREAARVQACSDLKVILANHIRDFRKPWPGCEFGKVLMGNDIKGALADLES